MAYGVVIDFGYVNYRILWIKFMFLRFKVCLVMGCSPNEGDGKKWIGSGMTLTGVRNG